MALVVLLSRCPVCCCDGRAISEGAALCMCVVRERGATVALVAQPHVTGFHGLDYQQTLYCDIHNTYTYGCTVLAIQSAQKV